MGVAFVSYFTWITLAIPVIATTLHRTFLPQPSRYKVEAELGLSLVLVFALRPWIERLPIQIRVAAALIGLSFAAEQVVGHRKFAKNVLASVDTASSIEYRVARWACREYAAARACGYRDRWRNGSIRGPTVSR